MKKGYQALLKEMHVENGDRGYRRSEYSFSK